MLADLKNRLYARLLFFNNTFLSTHDIHDVQENQQLKQVDLLKFLTKLSMISN